MTELHAYHVPAIEAVPSMDIVAERDGVRVVTPRLTAGDITTICDELLRAQERLQMMPVLEIVAAVDEAARLLANPTEPERAGVLRSLQSITGYSRPMAEHVLDRITDDWRAPALIRLLNDEFGGTAALDGFADAAGSASQTPPRMRVRSRAVPPRLGLHIFSGNVPGVSVTSIVRALLVRSAVLGKTAAAEPVLAAAFARILARVNPVVGACVAVTYWQGGSRTLEQAALEHVSLVVHYGRADAIMDLRARVHPRVKFVEHGPRISFAVIDGPAVRENERRSHFARETALAVSLFDQQGCVSPQLVYVIGEPADARVFASSLAQEMDRVQAELPRGRIESGEAAAIRDMRTHAEFNAYDGGGGEIWGAEDLHWTVIYTEDSAFEGTCLNRTVLVKCALDDDELLQIIRPYGAILQTVGFGGFTPESLHPLAAGLADAGVTRITPISAMPWPPPSWHHDGRGPLRELVQWVDFEE